MRKGVKTEMGRRVKRERERGKTLKRETTE